MTFEPLPGQTIPLLSEYLPLGASSATSARRIASAAPSGILTVRDFERSVAFYAKVLKPLGITNFTDYEGHDGHPDLKGLVTAKELFSGSKRESPIPKRCTLDL